MSAIDLPPLPYTTVDVDLHLAHTEAIGAAIKIEEEHAAHPHWDPLTVESAWWGCNSALDDAKSAHGRPDQHRYLVRLAGWAIAALRAEVREGKVGA